MHFFNLCLHKAHESSNLKEMVIRVGTSIKPVLKQTKMIDCKTLPFQNSFVN